MLLARLLPAPQLAAGDEDRAARCSPLYSASVGWPPTSSMMMSRAYLASPSRLAKIACWSLPPPRTAGTQDHPTRVPIGSAAGYWTSGGSTGPGSGTNMVLGMHLGGSVPATGCWPIQHSGEMHAEQSHTVITVSASMAAALEVSSSPMCAASRTPGSSRAARARQEQRQRCAASWPWPCAAGSHRASSGWC
jgi:hypothetical protein